MAFLNYTWLKSSRKKRLQIVTFSVKSFKIVQNKKILYHSIGHIYVISMTRPTHKKLLKKIENINISKRGQHLTDRPKSTYCNPRTMTKPNNDIVHQSGSNRLA